MLPLSYARRWLVASMVLLVSVFAAALTPVIWIWPDNRQFIAWFIHVDKWLHVITFVFLAVWFSGQYRSSSYWRIGIGLLLFGLLIEGCQRIVSYRTADWFDIAADAAGIIVGLSIAMAGIGGWSLRVEDWLTRRRAGAGID